MATTKINNKTDGSKIINNKTDWFRIYEQSQAATDNEAARDTENPVLKNALFKRVNDKRGNN